MPRRRKRIPADSNVEMSWRVLTGSYGGVYLALLKERCIRDGFGTDDDTVAQQFRLHLHRGISYLAADRNLRGIDNLIALVGRPGTENYSPATPEVPNVPE